MIDCQFEILFLVGENSRYTCSSSSNQNCCNNCFHFIDSLKILFKQILHLCVYGFVFLPLLHQELECSRSRVFELEQELLQKSIAAVSPTKIKANLSENVELIKLKRQCKKQSAQISTLEAQLQESEKGLNNFRSSVNYFNEQRGNFLFVITKMWLLGGGVSSSLKCLIRSLNISLSLLLDDNVRKHHEEVVNLVENKRKV